MKPLHHLHLITAMLLLAAMAACSTGEQRPTLTVSIEPQRYILEQIAGPEWQVNTLLDKNSDPENFDPTMDVMKSVMSSRAYFRAGNMVFEDVVTGRLSENNPDMMIVNTSKEIIPIYGTHDHGSHDAHSHGNADPHTWGSVRNARAIAAEMHRAMTSLDPEHADTYTANYRRLDSRLDSLDRAISGRLASKAGTSFLMWHPALSYFARDYGLRQLSLGADGKEMSARGLKDKIDQARGAGTHLFITQPDNDRSRTEEIASQTGMEILNVKPQFLQLARRSAANRRSHSRNTTAMTDENTIIRLDNVSLSWGGRPTLENVNLSINRGDFMAVTGPNGGGKTTLLRIILRLLKPTTGTVTYISDKDSAAPLTIGYLPQKNMIDSRFPITVREVAGLGLYNKPSLSASQRKKLIDEAIATVDLSENADSGIGNLSGGQLQRALLARAIIGRPEVLVLDEPLSYIDKPFERRIYEIIASLARDTTIILVSHEMSTIASMANRHIIVNGTLHFCQSSSHFMHYDCCEDS